MFVGLYGGTFDPIHLGHVHVARTIQAELNIATIHWLLATRPGHRSMPATSIEHRFNMLKLVCDEHPGFVADELELDNSRTSYTYDTLVAFRHRHPAQIPCWIIGMDSYVTLPDWYRWDELMTQTNLLVVERPDTVTPLTASMQAFERAYRRTELEIGNVGQVVYVERPMLSVSATQIRTHLARSEDAEHLLAPPVSAYISRHQLYVEKVA